MTTPNEVFRRERREQTAAMSRDDELLQAAQHFLDSTAKYKYSYNFDWLSRPIIQFPQDIVAFQEVVWAVKPDLIIETGIAHGGL